MVREKMTPDEVSDLVASILEWLDDPVTHLQSQSRRKAIELVLMEYAERVRAQERWRTRVRDFMLYFSALAAVAALFGPTIVEFLRRAL